STATTTTTTTTTTTASTPGTTLQPEMVVTNTGLPPEQSDLDRQKPRMSMAGAEGNLDRVEELITPGATGSGPATVETLYLPSGLEKSLKRLQQQVNRALKLADEAKLEDEVEDELIGEIANQFLLACEREDERAMHGLYSLMGAFVSSIPALQSSWDAFDN